MTVVVHSFVADRSLLDCCDLVCFFGLFWVFFPPYAVQVGNCLGFWDGFSCFVSFIWCQLFAWLIREAIFCLPPAFVVCSFFLCHRHLWSVLSFFATGICAWSLSFMAVSAIGIRVRLFVFALLVLVSGYQCISVFGIMLCTCCSSASSLEIWSGFFLQVSYPMDCPTNSALKQTPLGIPLSSLQNRTQRSARYTYGRDWHNGHDWGAA